MKNNKYFWILLSVLTIVGVTGLTFWTNAQNNKKPKNDSKNILIETNKSEFPFLNLSNSLKIIFQSETDYDYTVEFKNISNKQISGFTVLLPDGGTITKDYTISGKSIAPNQAETILIPKDSAKNLETLKQQMKVDAVVFDDGTSEGSEDTILQITDRRKGIKKQLEKALPLLRNLNEKSDSDLFSNLKVVKLQLSNLPTESTEKVSSAFNNGLYDAKQDLLRLINQIEKSFDKNKIGEFRNNLSKEMAEQEARLSRLN